MQNSLSRTGGAPNDGASPATVVVVKAVRPVVHRTVHTGLTARGEAAAQRGSQHRRRPAVAAAQHGVGVAGRGGDNHVLCAAPIHAGLALGWLGPGRQPAWERCRAGKERRASVRLKLCSGKRWSTAAPQGGPTPAVTLPYLACLQAGGMVQGPAGLELADALSPGSGAGTTLAGVGPFSVQTAVPPSISAASAGNSGLSQLMWLHGTPRTICRRSRGRLTYKGSAVRRACRRSRAVPLPSDWTTGHRPAVTSPGSR